LAGAASAQTYSVGTNPQGSLAYAVGAGVAKVVSEASGLKMRVVPQGGPVVTLPLVDNGELNFSIAASVVAAFGQTGGAMFKGRKQPGVRMAAALFPLRTAFYVRKDSDIKTMKDLKGKRLSTQFNKQPINFIFGKAQLATVGLSYDDVTGVPVVNGVRQLDDFMAGKVDAFTFSLTSGQTSQAHAKVGIRALSLDNSSDGLAALKKIAPGALIETVNPGPAYPGIEAPVNVLSTPFILTASSKVSDDIVYKVVKAIYEGKAKLVAAHKAFGDMDAKKLNVDLGIPYHPGALKLYKEKGQ
jgi:TRAP transporter TAXI family solute receptor